MKGGFDLPSLVDSGRFPAALNPDDLTPKAALETLYKLKDLARKDRS